MESRWHRDLAIASATAFFSDEDIKCIYTPKCHGCGFLVASPWTRPTRAISSQHVGDNLWHLLRWCHAETAPVEFRLDMSESRLACRVFGLWRRCIFVLSWPDSIERCCTRAITFVDIAQLYYATSVRFWKKNKQANVVYFVCGVFVVRWRDPVGSFSWSKTGLGLGLVECRVASVEL